MEKAFTSLVARTAHISHAVAAQSYQFDQQIHANPADRILMATARSIDANSVTADVKIINNNAVKIIRARE